MPSPPWRVRAAKDDSEVSFFSNLKHEVTKISAFYKREERRVTTAFAALESTDYEAISVRRS